MVEYRDRGDTVIEMEDALTLDSFKLVWSQGTVECTRSGNEQKWWLALCKEGRSIPLRGAVTRGSDGAFHRIGSANSYNTFEEAARRIVSGTIPMA